MAEKVCSFNKFGFCKYGEKCHLTHINIICEKQICDQSECDYRHPKLCEYFEMFRRCKFTSFCKFSHKINYSGQEHTKCISNDKIDTIMKATEALENNMKDLKNRMEFVEKELKEKNNAIIELGDKIRELENINETYKLKETMYDEKINTLQEKIDEKNPIIDSLKENMDYCDEILAKEFLIHIYPNMYCEKCKLKYRMRDERELEKHMESIHRIFKCDFDFTQNCEFVFLIKSCTKYTYKRNA